MLRIKVRKRMRHRLVHRGDPPRVHLSDRKRVHGDRELASVYTNSPAQPAKWTVPDKILSIREVRANLRACIDSGKAVRIGGWHQVRAILVPVEPERTWDEAKRKSFRDRAKKLFSEAITKGEA